MVATGLIAGRTATCYRAVKEELEARRGYLDREVVVDAKLITSRQSSGIPAFISAIFGALRL